MAPFKGEIKLSNIIRFTAKNHFYNKEIIYQVVARGVIKILLHLRINRFISPVLHPKKQKESCFPDGQRVKVTPDYSITREKRQPQISLFVETDNLQHKKKQSSPQRPSHQI